MESCGFIRCCRPRFAWAGLGQSSLLERLAERVEFKAQVLGDFSSAPTNPQQLLCLGGDLRRHHRSTACRTRCVKRFHAPGAILVDATNDAVLRDAEGPHDIDLAARTYADQLGGEHLKSAAFVLGMLKQGLSAAEVDPLDVIRNKGYNSRMMTYATLQSDRREFLALTGLTLQEFQLLLNAFTPAYERRYPKDRTLADRPRQRCAGGGRKGVLDSPEQKLLFLLVYPKTYYPGTEEAHTNPTRQRGECLRALAGASG